MQECKCNMSHGMVSESASHSYHPQPTALSKAASTSIKAASIILNNKYFHFHFPRLLLDCSITCNLRCYPIQMIFRSLSLASVIIKHVNDLCNCYWRENNKHKATAKQAIMQKALQPFEQTSFISYLIKSERNVRFHV